MARPDRAGDPALDLLPTSGGLEVLYRQHAGWLATTLKRRLGALANEADDLVQETYLRVARYEAAGLVRHPRALLLRIAGNLARDRARRAAARPAVELAADASPVLPEQDSELLLKQIILSLPEPYRDVFVLSRFTTMSYEDIAAHFGLSVKTVEWRMSKALALCASQLRG